VAEEFKTSEGGALCLVTVSLDASAVDQVRRAAAQAGAGLVTNFTSYLETVPSSQLEKLLTGTEAVVCLIDFEKDKNLAVQTASTMQTLTKNHATLIALSSEENPDLILHAMRAGCTEYLTKPLRIEQLAELLRNPSDGSWRSWESGEGRGRRPSRCIWAVSWPGDRERL